MAAPRVAVIVPTYQRADRLPHLIAALETQTLPYSEFEVIISDDCSADRTADVLAELASRSPLNLRVVRTDRNSGPAVARNIGWRSTQASLLAFFDDDCLPTPRWLEAGIALFNELDVGIVQGRTIPDPSSPLDPYSTLGYKTVTQSIRGLTNRYEGCNVFYRRAVLEEVGGFDETLAVSLISGGRRYFFGDDSGAAWAARRLGAGDRFAADALVHHEIRTRGIRWYLRWALLHRNWPLLVRRFPEMRESLWFRFFLWPRHAAILLAGAGTAVGVVWPPGFVLTVPFLAHYLPWRLKKDEFLGRAAEVVFDVLVMGSIAVGAVRRRTPML